MRCTGARTPCTEPQSMPGSACPGGACLGSRAGSSSGFTAATGPFGDSPRGTEWVRPRVLMLMAQEARALWLCLQPRVPVLTSWRGVRASVTIAPRQLGPSICGQGLSERSSVAHPFAGCPSCVGSRSSGEVAIETQTSGHLSAGARNGGADSPGWRQRVALCLGHALVRPDSRSALGGHCPNQPYVTADAFRLIVHRWSSAFCFSGCTDA